MNVTRKDATITNVDEDFPGSFQVVLSTPAKDRDGDELASEDWKQPLPDHITFDIDHGMSVEKTVGSGKPYIDDQGRVIVDGTYSSLQKAQDTRTLVKEGHIRTVSVAFSSHKTTKDGKTRTTRELLNGAFVAIPANTEAVVLSAKAGARNAANDQKNLQVAHDAIVAAGAECGPMDDTGAAEGATGGKSVREVETKAKYDAETLRQMLADGHALANPDGNPSYPIADREDLENAIHAVGRGEGDHDKIRAYITRRAEALDAADLIPDGWNADGSMKAVDGAQVKAIEPGALVSASVSGCVAGFDISINAWCVPADQIDAYTDTAQRALTAALEIASAGPVDDDSDESSTEETTSNTDVAKSADADALDMQLIALRVIAAAHGE